MEKYNNFADYLIDLGEAIAEKTQTTEEIHVNEFAQKVHSIKKGNVNVTITVEE